MEPVKAKKSSPDSVRRLLLVLSLELFYGPLAGQSIRGRVMENEGKPLPFVNLLLLREKDSTLVKGAVSDASGAYTLQPVPAGSYLLSASLMGYKRAYVPHITIAEGQTAVNLPVLALALETKQLKGITVVGQKPLYEQQIDRTVVNVASSIVASGSTALEVLEKAPGVIVDRQNEGISLQGKEGVLVMIDGKQTYLALADVVALLRSMPSDNIDQIELITSPPAKYEAAGNAGIINIRLKKNNNTGTNGSVSLAGGSGRHDRERGSLQLNHRTQKLNLFASYSASRGGNYWLLSTRQDRQADGEHVFTNQGTYLRFREKGHNTKAGLEYKLGKQNTLGLVWTGLWSSRKERGPASSYFRNEPSGPVYQEAQTNRTLSNVLSNQVGNVNITHTFPGKGGELTADLDGGHLQKEFSNELRTVTTIFDEPASNQDGLLNYMPVGIHIYTGKTDYSRALSKDWKLETGYKHSFVRTDNNLTFLLGPVGELEPDPELSNHFRYQEQINAAYTTLRGKLDANTEVLLGLRAEHTHSIAHSLSAQKRVERNYLNLFPSVFLSRTLNQQQKITFSYSRRIDRPNYELLNPGRSYVDPYLYSQGNPYLQPQYTQMLELKHGYKEQLFTSLSASYTTDLIFALLVPVSTTVTERYPVNIGQSQVYTLAVSFPVEIVKGWSLQATLLNYYSRFQYRFLEQPVDAGQLWSRLNGTSSWILGKGWSAELSGWVSTSRRNVFVSSPWQGTLDAGLQKNLSSRLKAKLALQDVFHTNQVIGRLRTPTYNRDVRIKFDTRIALLNLTYSFGNQHLKGARQRKTAPEDELQRTN